MVARTIPADRFSTVVAAAAQVFITHGYQRAQVQDVADALNLGKGTLYGYVQGKAALFAAAVRYADGHEPLPDTSDLPITAPADGEVAALIAGRLAGEITQLALVRALIEPLPTDPAAGDAQLAGIVTDLYERLARHRIAIKLVDRCAPELPDLAAVWFGAGRHARVEALGEYLTRRQDAGTLILPGPALLLARTIVETCALWAVHSHFDPAADPDLSAPREPVDDPPVAAMLANIFVRATRTPA